MYPTRYTNISKRMFLETDVTPAAIILFIPEDGYHDQPEMYPDGYIPNLKAHAETAKDVLYIPAEDVGVNWGLNFKRPTAQHFEEINNFLKKNADNPILAVCDAGVSRSGFVTFFLDVKNDRLDGVSYSPDYTGFDPHFIRRSTEHGTFYHTNPALTKFMLESDVLTTKERKALAEIAKNTEKDDSDITDSEWFI
mgnify:CR=1 FL=1